MSMIHGQTGEEPNPSFLRTMTIDLATLPLDILDRILVSLNDFSSLGASVLTCRALYDAYQARPTSVTWAVASNLVPGSVLPAAVRAARLGDILERPLEEDNGGPTRMTFLLEFGEAAMLDGALSWANCMALQRCASVVSKTEVLFSQRYCQSPLVAMRSVFMLKLRCRRRCKDKASGTTSRLTPEESVSFQKAVYRIWLFCSATRYVFTRFAGVFSDFHGRKAALYHALSTQELWELDTVWRWMCDEVSRMNLALDGTPHAIPIPTVRPSLFTLPLGRRKLRKLPIPGRAGRLPGVVLRRFAEDGRYHATEDQSTGYYDLGGGHERLVAGTQRGLSNGRNRRPRSPRHSTTSAQRGR